YALTRPDWMPALVAGQVPSEIADHPAARWQAVLIATALERARRAPVPMLPWLRRRAGVAPPRLAAPIDVFGMSFLARAQLEALTDLATTTDVVIYALDPCRELWDDIGGRSTTEAGIDPMPLVLWGRPIRDTLSSLVDRAAGDLDARFVDDTPVTALGRLLADVSTRQLPRGDVMTDAGVTVLACPNLRREIEVVAAQARACLDADATLSAHQIGVWIAGDAARYLAQAPSAFEAVGVPCHQIDAPIDDRGRIGEAVLALLELPTSTMGRRDLLRVMTHPAVLAGYPHIEATDWVRWTERLGIVHGADGSAHDGTYLEDHRDQFHWDQGVRRLALGAFMIGERPGDDRARDAVRIGKLEVAPEEIRPDQQASAATYALLVRSLCKDAAWLAGLDVPLARWADIFVELVEVYLGSRDESIYLRTRSASAARPPSGGLAIDGSGRDLERVRKMLAGLAHLDLDGRPVGFREAREHAIHQLATARANRGEPLAAGVMISPLAAMRAVPFEICFVVGLDTGAFPAGDQPSPLDLRRDHRPGDVPPRDRDRAAFLEVLLCTRRHLYASYVAVEDKSGQPLGPSSVVLELADALAPYLGAASSRDALTAITRHHPLHRFGETSPVPPAIARERWAVSVRDALRAHLRAGGHSIPDEDGVMELLAHPAQAHLRAALGIVPAPEALAVAASRPVSIASLRTFLRYPVQAWAQAVLGLDELPDDAVADTSDEPFQLDRPERVELLREVFSSQLRDPGVSVAALYQAIVDDRTRRGQFPVGVFAEAAKAVDVAILDSWRTKLGPIAVGGVTRIGFGRSSSSGAELLPALEIPLSGGRTVRLVGQTDLLLRPRDSDRHTSVITTLRKLDKKTAEHLRGAFDHVLLAAAGLAPAGHSHIILDAKGGMLRVDHEPWKQADARGYLGELVGELFDLPHGYLLPFEALARVLAGEKPRTYADRTNGLGYGPIERRDGLAAPPDATAIAMRRLAPLVAKMRGDHAFEVKPGPGGQS
ncbi:MAG TPA: exodeoxyribonuclease V subunit gamma, partial [Kofleriaceae bacterium]|nr:exodeoxyribonuclease V subunit gamma [Kofleriaceae bacterium]